MRSVDEVAAGIAEVEAELRRLGRWADEPPAPEAFESSVAFHGDTMAFEQWLQFVLVPRVRSVLGGEGSLPVRSAVGAYAVRALDGDPDAGELVALLARFDDAVEALAGMAGPQGTAALEAAAGRGDADAVAAALAAGAEGSATALTWAASSGSSRAVADLLASGVDPDVQDVYGVTPVFFAAGYGHTGICAWLIDPVGTSLGEPFWGEHAPTLGHLEVLRLLLAKGVAFDARYAPLGGHESGGGTPLILAAALGHVAACEELLRFGASTLRTDVTGRTAADWAETRGFHDLAQRLRTT